MGIRRNRRMALERKEDARIEEVSRDVRLRRGSAADGAHHFDAVQRKSDDIEGRMSNKECSI